MRTVVPRRLGQLALSLTLLTAASSVAQAQWSYTIYDNPSVDAGDGTPFGPAFPGCSGVAGTSIGVNFNDTGWEALCPALALQDDHHFAAHFTTFIHVNVGDNYLFHLLSDDGSAMYLDGNTTPFLAFLGDHGEAEGTATPFLSAGDHVIDVNYFEWEGTHHLQANFTDVLHGTPTGPTPVVGTPEPASIAMMLTGFGILGGARMRRRRNQKA
jgi:PA14 domain-containing protein/PEP-CTERM motif-containing protein